MQPILKNGLTKVTAFKTLGHGLARGVISKFQGGSFNAGFLSGLTSGFDVGTKGYGGILGRTGIMAIAGGTVSVIGGGKFSNGAFGGAMTHLFNAEIKPTLTNAPRKEEIMARDKEGRKQYMTDKLSNISDYMNTHHAVDDSGLLTFWAVLSLPVILPRALLFGTTAVISYPIETSIGIGVVD
ncbi:MAG: hypothetical protein FAF03_11130, partial [Epsilonproteobacteria bacterium]|nr:hypothetical protein [Campylobacterota bacterium]